MGRKRNYTKPVVAAIALASAIIAGVIIKMLIIKKHEKETEKPAEKSFQKAVFWTIASGLIEALAKLAVHQTSMWAEKRL